MSKQAVSLKEANKKQASSLLRKNIRKFVNNKLAMLGLAFVVIIVAASVLAPVLTSYDPERDKPWGDVAGAERRAYPRDRYARGGTCFPACCTAGAFRCSWA